MTKYLLAAMIIIMIITGCSLGVNYDEEQKKEQELTTTDTTQDAAATNTTVETTIIDTLSITDDLIITEAVVEFADADLIVDNVSEYYPSKVKILPNGDLAFGIKNQGFKTAPASVTRIIFYISGTPTIHNIPTPELTAGETFITPGLTPPYGWFNPDGDFKVIADYYNQVEESDELNNTSTGTIVG